MLLSLAIGIVRALSWRSTQMAFAEESIQEKKEYCDSLNGIYNFEAEKIFVISKRQIQLTYPFQNSILY